MQIVGTIATVLGIVAIIFGCVMSLRRMQKLQDLGFKQKNPQGYKKLKSDISSFIFVGVGIFAFILGFIFMNFF